MSGAESTRIELARYGTKRTSTKGNTGIREDEICLREEAGSRINLEGGEGHGTIEAYGRASIALRPFHVHACLQGKKKLLFRGRQRGGERCLLVSSNWKRNSWYELVREEEI